MFSRFPIIQNNIGNGFIILTSVWSDILPVAEKEPEILQAFISNQFSLSAKYW